MKKRFTAIFLCLSLFFAKPAGADMWGGDLVILAQLLSNAVQQLVQLRMIFTTSTDTLGLLKEVNRGIKNGLDALQVINPKFNPGLYGNLEDADHVLNMLRDLYGVIPKSSQSRLQTAQDQMVAESIAMNGKTFSFAVQADNAADRIVSHSRLVNPQGAAKLQSQATALLVNVTTQLLRTNSTMLKLMAQNMALENRKDKLSSAQFKAQYDGLSEAFRTMPNTTQLPTLGD